jgi:hypothetical protein
MPKSETPITMLMPPYICIEDRREYCGRIRRGTEVYKRIPGVECSSVLDEVGNYFLEWLVREIADRLPGATT